MNTLNSRPNTPPGHSSRNLGLDIADVFDAVDVTPLDDEPFDDMVNVPHDPTGDRSDKQQTAELTRRVKTMAHVIRPTPDASQLKERDQAMAPPPSHVEGEMVSHEAIVHLAAEAEQLAMPPYQEEEF